MDKLTAAGILGISPGSSKEDIREAFRNKTANVRLEDDPETFGRLQTAYRVMMRAGADASFSPEYLEYGEAAPDALNNSKGSAYAGAEDIENLFSRISEDMPETEEDSSQLGIMQARVGFSALWKQPASEYDYNEMLKCAELSDFSPRECRKIADRIKKDGFTVLKFGKNRVRRTEGFDSFLSYLYARAGKGYHPMPLRVWYYFKLVLALFPIFPVTAAYIHMLVSDFTVFSELTSPLTRVLIIERDIFSVLFIVGFFPLTRLMARKRSPRKTYAVVYFLYIVIMIALSVGIALLFFKVIPL